MDLQIFQTINDFAGKWPWLDKVGIFVASGMAYVLFAVLVALWFLRKEHRRMVLMSILSAVIARGIFVEIIRAFYHRARPISVDAVHQLVTNDAWAFPSGHASFFFAIATSVFIYNTKLGYLFYIFAALMGVARIFIGVHWPTDIIVGASLGMLVAIGLHSIATFRRGDRSV